MPLRTGKRDWLWAATAVVIAVIAIFAVYIVAFAGDDDEVITYETVAGVPCESGEHFKVHRHVRLAIHLEGEEFAVPPNTGIRYEQPTPATPGGPMPSPVFRCLFWLHTHSDALVHVESSGQNEFTLGQFFAIWGQPLSETQLLDRTAQAEKEVQAFVNGEPWTGNPADIPLVDQEVISLQYGPPFVEPPTELID
jgi:hypothetical protein